MSYFAAPRRGQPGPTVESLLDRRVELRIGIAMLLERDIGPEGERDRASLLERKEADLAAVELEIQKHRHHEASGRNKRL